MNISTIIGLVNNAALLLALGLLYDTLGPKPRGGKLTIQQALAGVILGAIGIAVMLTPWEFAPGVVFDTRSVLLSVSGLFFGSLPTLVAVLMTGAFRLYQGGGGAWTGTAVIVTSGAIGVAWRHLRRRELEDLSIGELYVMGLVVHIAMLLWMLSLPWSLAMGVLSAISLPVMVIYPAGTVLLGWLMVNRDARKRAEEGQRKALAEALQATHALRESEVQYRALFNNVVDPVFIFDRETNLFLDCNQTATSWYGYTLDELRTMTPAQLHPPDEVEIVERNISDGEDGIPHYYTHITKDGDHLQVEIRTDAVEYKGRRAWLSVVRDITERKRAEEALRESEEKLRLFMESATDSFILYNSELNVVEVNKVGLGMLPPGTRKEDVVGKNMLEIAPGLEKTGRYDQYLKVIETGEPFFVDDFVPHPIVGDRYLALRAFKVGEGLGIVVADITKRKLAEEALKEYSERLEEMVEERTKQLREAQEQLVRREKLAVLGQLAGGVGHELRNPLGVISNAVYFLQMTLPDADETTKESLEMISAEVRNSTKIISDLLDFSRTRLPDREEAAVPELAAEVLKKHPPPEEVEATTQIAPDLPPVYVDLHQMGQVLVNLVVNAYQAMKEGGKLTISAQAEEGQVALSVTDTGSGISQENMAKIFEPLFTTKARGIGLGLAVSRSLVEANGGSIKVESEEGKGSTFTVRLPTREEVA